MPSTSKEADELNAPRMSRSPPPRSSRRTPRSAGAAVAGGLRAVEVAAVVLLGLLVCPPLAILAFLVVVPVLVARRSSSGCSPRSCRRRTCSSTTSARATGATGRCWCIASAGPAEPSSISCRTGSSPTPARDGARPVTAAAATPIRHLRPRGDGATQPTTTVELFFDLVYVFAVTQLSHQILDDLSVAGVARAGVPAARRLVGVDLHDLDGQLVRPGSPAVRGGAHRR